MRETSVRFSKHPKGVYGKPDAGHKGKKIAVFFDSEFWHGYDWKQRKKDFKSNRKFWLPKIERNMRRDREVNRRLRKNGWTVIRIWEKDMAKNKRQKTLKRLSMLLPVPQYRFEWQPQGELNSR